MILTMNADLGAGGNEFSPTAHYLDNGALAITGGNLYLYVDGEEYGSLFFTVQDGRVCIELGQFDYGTEEWETRNPLTASVAETRKE